MTATMPVVSDVRDCRLYRFYGWDPRTGYTTKTLIYVGETVRQPLERLLEHLYAQPWADTITSWEVDDRVFAGKSAVLDAETRAIQAERPLYNVKQNERNPHRIPPPLAIKQRRARDAAKGKPRWVHPDDRVSDGARQPTSAASVRRRSASRPWRPWQKRLVGWSSAWLTVVNAAFFLFAYFGAFAALWDDFIGGLVAGSALIVWVMCGAPVPVGRWKRRARKVRRRLW